MTHDEFMLPETLSSLRQKVEEIRKQGRPAGGLYFSGRPKPVLASELIATPDELAEFVSGMDFSDGERRRIINGYRHQYNTPLPR